MMLTKIRQIGLLYSIGIAFNRVVPSWLFRFRIFTVYQIESKTAVAQTPVASNSYKNSVQVSLAQSDADIAAVRKVTWFQQEDMDADFHAVQARIDGQPAGGVWAAERGFDETDLGLRIELSDRQSWIFAALVDEQFRRRGVYTRLINFMTNHLEQKTGGQQFISINPTNIVSVRAHEKYVASVLGNVVAMRVLGIAFCRCSGQRLRTSSWVSIGVRSRPILIHLQ
jgi:GNAT superfamily N-acetyltransferase